MKRKHLVLLIVTLVIFLDQSSKIWVKTNMSLGQEFFIFGDWFRIHFIENPGMAFGLTFGGDYGKLALSLFRIVAVSFMLYLLVYLVKNKASKGLVACLSLIFAGAMGNILDSAFYGLFFSGSYHGVAHIFPEGGGYAGFLHGRVVDMLYFPVYNDYLPNWVPFFGGEHVEFFRPIFNLADVSITVGVASIIIFQGRYFVDGDIGKEPTEGKAALKEDIVLGDPIASTIVK